MEEQETLTNSERESMRAYLKSFMGVHRARAPFSIRILDWVDATLLASEGGTRFAFGKLASASLVLVMFVGFGTSYAAQDALPGQALYGVKVHVNETLEGALAFSPVAKAQFDAELTTRRLEEAEVLAAANQLTPEVSTELQVRIDESAANFNDSVMAVAQSDGIDAAQDAQSDLEAALSAHVNVLAAITATAPDTREVLSPIISTVETHVASAREARADSKVAAALVASSTGTSAEPSRSIAAKKKESAQEAIGKVRTLANNAEVSGGAATSTSISRRAQQVEEVAREGDKYLNDGDYQRAADSFDTAIRAATQTQVEASVSMQLKKILPALPITEPATSTKEIVGVSGGTSATTTVDIITSPGGENH